VHAFQVQYSNENRERRKLLASKETVTSVKWCILHNEKLRGLYSSLVQWDSQIEEVTTDWT